MINSEKFYSSWVKNTRRRENEMSQSWNHSSMLTELVIHSDDSIVFNIAEDLRLNCCNRDYYCIDSVFFEESDLTPGVDGIWLRDMRVAF